jgi:hypothetical protein
MHFFGKEAGALYVRNTYLQYNPNSFSHHATHLGLKTELAKVLFTCDSNFLEVHSCYRLGS